MWASAVEHSTLYQYQFANTQNVYMGFIQSETPYYQPNPSAPTPWTPNTSLNDPTWSCSGTCAMAWGLRILDSSNLLVYGAGLYSFFNNYDVTCSFAPNSGAARCQQQIATLDGSYSSLSFYGFSTVSVDNMLVTNGGSSVVAYANDNLNVYNDCVAIFHS